jgi:hypothetical protein
VSTRHAGGEDQQSGIVLDHYETSLRGTTYLTLDST